MNNNKLSYFKHLCAHKSKTDLINEINDAPLKKNEAEFIVDCVFNLSYKELQTKYNLSRNGCYKRKLKIIDKLYLFFFNKIN